MSSNWNWNISTSPTLYSDQNVKTVLDPKSSQEEINKIFGGDTHHIADSKTEEKGRTRE